jgi:murein DD-endopeptidase MepM/ murein hydrolase activator NlpD
MSTLPRPALVLAALALVAIAMIGAAPERTVLAEEPNVNDAIAQQRKMEAELSLQRAQLAILHDQQESLNASLAHLSGELLRVGAELEAAQQELAELTAHLEETRQRLADYRARIARHEADLARIALEIEEAKVDLAEREGLLEEHLRATYEQSRVSLLEVLLSSDSFDQATTQLGYMLSLTDEDHRLAEEIEHSRERLEVKQQTLRDGRETLVQLEAEAALREADLARQQALADEARALLAQKEAELAEAQADHQHHLAEVTATAEEQAALIAAHELALEGHAAIVQQLKERALALDIAFHGRFEWPYDGAEWLVTQEFGDTSFDHEHTGIDLAYRGEAACAGPIYAAADGTVLADGQPNTAYGDEAVGVIIGHSQRLQSWYWHLSSEVVSVDQQVKAGDLIGYEGATGLATGCHLHFQVMFDEEPVEPRDYLP